MIAAPERSYRHLHRFPPEQPPVPVSTVKFCAHDHGHRHQGLLYRCPCGFVVVISTGLEE